MKKKKKLTGKAYKFTETNNYQKKDYHKDLQVEDIIELEPNLYKLPIRIGKSHKYQDVYFDEVYYRAIMHEGVKIELWGKNKRYVVMHSRKVHEPAYISLGMWTNQIPVISLNKNILCDGRTNKKFNQYKPYYAIFKDGNQYNLRKDNVLVFKFTDEQRAKIADIENDYIENERPGSLTEVMSYIKSIVDIDYVSKYSIPSNYTIMCNFDDAWTKEPKGGTNKKTHVFEGEEE